MSCFMMAEGGLPASFHPNVKRPTSTALKRQLCTDSQEIIRLANQCIGGLMAREAAISNHQPGRDISQLKKRLIRYSRKEEDSCLRKAPNTSITKLMQSKGSSADALCKYNRVLAVRIGSAITAEEIEAEKLHYVRWNNQHNLNALTSANFRRVLAEEIQMQFRLKQAHKQSKSQLYHKSRVGQSRGDPHNDPRNDPRCDYSPQSKNRRKFW